MKNLVLLFLVLFHIKVSFAQDTSISKSKYNLHDIVTCALKDTNGHLWFGTNYRGIYHYDGDTFIHLNEKDGLTKREINSLFQDRSGTIWAATGDGAYRFDGKKFSRFPIPVDTAIGLSNKSTSGFIQGYKSHVVSCIQQDKEGNIWFGTMSHGVYRYDGKTFVNFLQDEWIFCMALDQTGKMWFGSQKSGGLYCYDGKAFSNFTSKDGLSDNWIRCIVPDKEAYIWIGTRKRGICIYDPSAVNNPNKKLFTILNDTLKSCEGAEPILQDKNGFIWLAGCGAGVRRYDPTSSNKSNIKPFICYTVKDGLGTNRITSIVEDNKGNIWFGGNSGSLVRFDPSATLRPGGKSFKDFSDKIHK